jgi:oligopeptide/dipeptide ABC transporter ATP-binding protein
MTNPILAVSGCYYTYRTEPSGFLGLGGRRRIPALNGLDLTLAPGRVTGLLGESGSGKSTLALVLSGNLPLERGELFIEGAAVHKLGGNEKRRAYRRVGLVPQFAQEALAADVSVLRQFTDRLRRHGIAEDEAQRRIRRALEQVRLPAHFAERTPGSMSGGERQRVAIARALTQNPRLLILDEPVAAVDLRLQESLTEMLLDLRRDGLALLWISHDLRQLRTVSEDLAVLHRGRVVEAGSAQTLFTHPLHPYTRQLLAPDTGLAPSPDPLVLPTGCAYHPTCKLATAKCNQMTPSLRLISDRYVACTEVQGHLG